MPIEPLVTHFAPNTNEKVRPNDESCSKHFPSRRRKAMVGRNPPKGRKARTVTDQVFNIPSRRERFLPMPKLY